jgi:peroxin-5
VSVARRRKERPKTPETSFSFDVSSTYLHRDFSRGCDDRPTDHCTSLLREPSRPPALPPARPRGMDLLQDLVGRQGCGADGTASARNPMGELVESLMQAHPQQPQRPPRGPLGPAQMQQMQQMQQQQMHHQQMVEMNEGMTRGAAMARSGMGRGGVRPMMQAPAPMMQMMPSRPMHQMMPMPTAPQMRMGNAAAFDGAWEQAGAGPDPWAGEFARMQQGRGGPPPAMMMGDAWAASAANMHMEAAWGRPAAGPPPPQMSAAQMGMGRAWELSSHPGQAEQKQDSSLGDLRQEYDDSPSAAWAGLDSGVGADEVQAPMDKAWDEAQRRMEAAWEEAKTGLEGGDPELQRIWDGGEETLEEVWSRTAAELEAPMRAAAGEYAFAEENEYRDASEPFSKGLAAFEEGDVRSAILFFEAEVQRCPENSEAWRMLGLSHAENDEDQRAIVCLERSVEQDPYNLEALLALGVSCVNELDSGRALRNLKSWVEHNPKYAGLQIQLDEYSDGTLMDEVMQLMLQVLQWDPTDADAKVVLGVLYNVSRDFDSAAKAFRDAIASRPDDYSLWNKLGATLANFNKSEEALPAYQEALRRRPRYVRGWLNIGISLANLSQHGPAATCYLRALQMNPEARHIWSYLRIVFTCMERFDLVRKASAEDINPFLSDFALHDGLPAGADGMIYGPNA